MLFPSVDADGISTMELDPEPACLPHVSGSAYEIEPAALSNAMPRRATPRHDGFRGRHA